MIHPGVVPRVKDDRCALPPVAEQQRQAGLDPRQRVRELGRIGHVAGVDVGAQRDLTLSRAQHGDRDLTKVCALLLGVAALWHRIERAGLSKLRRVPPVGASRRSD